MFPSISEHRHTFHSKSHYKPVTFEHWRSSSDFQASCWQLAQKFNLRSWFIASKSTFTLSHINVLVPVFLWPNKQGISFRVSLLMQFHSIACPDKAPAVLCLFWWRHNWKHSLRSRIRAVLLQQTSGSSGGLGIVFCFLSRQHVTGFWTVVLPSSYYQGVQLGVYFPWCSACPQRLNSLALCVWVSTVM